MHDYEDSSLKLTAHLPKDACPVLKATEIAAHPIAAYRMIRRFATEFHSIREHISQNLETRKS